MRQRVALVLALAVLAALGVGYLARNDPEEGIAFFPKCVFRETTGWNCAGCGGTRAAYALTQGDVATAFRKNPLLLLMAPFLAAGILMEGAAWVFKERYRGPRVRIPGRLAWVFPVVIVSYWVLRNVPVWPFELLAPR